LSRPNPLALNVLGRACHAGAAFLYSRPQNLAATENQPLGASVGMSTVLRRRAAAQLPWGVVFFVLGKESPPEFGRLAGCHSATRLSRKCDALIGCSRCGPPIPPVVPAQLAPAQSNPVPDARHIRRRHRQSIQSGNRHRRLPQQ